ncbi:hypothetical protein MRX96_026093 [Rhipicephalus microplus]
MKKEIFEVKATDAIRKNFKEVWVCAPEVKSKAVALCNEHGMTRLAKGLSDAVVVAPNVRLGVLGFLHPKKVEGITPDVAEEDMMVAMQWAMDNAAVFGADPSALMLVGNGSGAYMLVQAAGRLSVPVSRAVIEGSVFVSGLPANDVSAGSRLLSA